MFKRELRVEWGDCDPAGIVFYPRYLAWFDANTAYLMEAAGLPRDRLIGEYGIAGMPLINVEAKFLLPSRVDDRIVIVSRLASCSRARIAIDHRIMRGDDLAVEGREHRVWAAAETPLAGSLRIAAVPQTVVDLLIGGTQGLHE
jgi:4-hydroxybenzoyl-CoA thioesterase